MSFANTANLLMRRCTSRPRRIVGGIATGLGISIAGIYNIFYIVLTFLGVEEVLALEMRSYRPTVSCEDPLGPPPENCFDIINIIPTGEHKRRFGRRGTPGIDVPLGIVLQSGALKT